MAKKRKNSNWHPERAKQQKEKEGFTNKQPGYLKSKNLCFILMLSGLIISYTGAGKLWQMVLGLAVMLAGVIQMVIFYRCPDCHKSLFHWTWQTPVKCPRCGRRL